MSSGIAAILLAAGASRRMGRDKLLLPVAGVPMLRHAALAALDSAATPVIATLPAGGTARRAALDGLTVQIVEVGDAGEGMAASLRAGVAALPAGIHAAIVALADMPGVTADHYAALIAAFTEDPARTICRCADATGRPGHPVLFAACHFPTLAALTGDVGARTLLKTAKVHTVPTPDLDATTDIDTPEDWETWNQQND